MRILRGVGSHSLPCGCLIGFYETYNGPVVAIVDARGVSCDQPSHHVDSEIPRDVVAGKPEAQGRERNRPQPN
jgi:hypothetical protein